MNDDATFMAQALRLAQQAADAGEVPVGAVLVLNNAVVGQGFNQPIGRCDPSAHAEVLALRDAGGRLGNYRFPNSRLYVTIEPCAMCFGALVHGRVAEVIYGASEPKAGVCSTQGHWVNGPWFNHKVVLRGGVMAQEAQQLMQGFFASRRAAIKQLKQRGDVK